MTRKSPIDTFFLFMSRTMTGREIVLEVKPTVSEVLQLQHFIKYDISPSSHKKCSMRAVDISLV